MRPSRARAERMTADYLAAVAEIERAGESLASPFSRAIAEANRWRDNVLARLAEVAEGQADYAERVVEVNEIAAARIEAAWAEEAERRLRESRRWEDGVTRALRDIADEAGDFGLGHGAGDTRCGRGHDRCARRVRDYRQARLLEPRQPHHHRARPHRHREAHHRAVGRGARGALQDRLHPAQTAIRLPAGSASRRAGAAGLLHTGGIVGALGGRQRLVAPSLFDHAPRHHGGGIAGRLRPGEVPIIAEKGEGVFTPEQMRALAPAGPPAVYVNFVNQGTGQREVAAGREVRFQPPNAWVIEVVTEDIDNGGPLRSRIERLASPGGGV